MDIAVTARDAKGIAQGEMKDAIARSLEGRAIKKALIIAPDFTRLYSNAGEITCQYYAALCEMGAQTDVLIALGTHLPMSREECAKMYPAVPFERIISHNWREGIVKLGQVPKDYVSMVSGGLWDKPISCEVNELVVDPSYDIVISVGQVVPHEVVGMANHSKNIFVGTGGSDMINSSHMLGAVYGMERMMGLDNTPVRKVFDYALTHFLSDVPLIFALTVTTLQGQAACTHGLFIGDERANFERAIALSQAKNIDFVERPIKKCVVYLEPDEFKSTWLGNKAIYRTRMAIADGGELIVLAPGVSKFGEDGQIDELIRKYGYSGRLNILDEWRKNDDLKANMSAAAHLIHGSSDNRFGITYATTALPQEQVRAVGFKSADCAEMCKKYDPSSLKYGINTVDGEEIFYIPNPALGLWIDKTKFKEQVKI